MSYFEQIIFPPQVRTVIKKIKDHFEFWFVTITNNMDNMKTIRLMVRCPLCDEAFKLRESIPSETIMRFALKENVNFYFEYIAAHCPKCHPNSPVNQDFLMKYNTTHMAG